MKAVYGPVPSWRLGRSLGIDPICSPSRSKICSFDCTYCQLGPTNPLTTERHEFVPVERVITELARALEIAEIDVVTFSGTGEPTLAINLPELVSAVRRETTLPIIILTNSSRMHMKEVRRALRKFDMVVAKLDAPDPDLLERINRPASGISFEDISDGLMAFRGEFNGTLALQMMFVPDNRDKAGEMADLARAIDPDEVQVNTPLRPSPVPPLSPGEISEISRHFTGIKTTTVYEARKIAADAMDIEETRLRRPLQG